MKAVAVTRKNTLFSDSPAGARASAIIFSIVNTAAANNIDSYKYLEYIFRQLPNLNFVGNEKILDEYLPWYEKVQQECKIKNTNTEEDGKGLCSEPA